MFKFTRGYNSRRVEEHIIFFREIKPKHPEFNDINENDLWISLEKYLDDNKRVGIRISKHTFNK